MATITVSAVRRPDGSRKGRNGKDIVLLGPVTISPPPTSTHNALPALGPYKFAFWSVTGSASGAFVSQNIAVTITMGSSDVVAKAWYVLANLKPPAPAASGVFVDAFDIDMGRFLDDDFVKVKDLKDQLDVQLTKNANDNGFLPTAVTQVVEAASPFTPVEPKVPGPVELDKWICFTGAEQINGQVVVGLQASTAEAIAFYRTHQQTSPTLREPGKLFAAQTWVSWGVMVDGGGPTGGGPVPPWDPLTLNLAAGLALAEAALKLHPTLQAEALTIAARQVAVAAQEIGKAITAASKSGQK